MDTREFSDNLEIISTKDYITLSGVFFEDKSPLLVLVEDQEDKPFWYKLFSCISDKYERIDVWPLHEASAHEMQQTDVSGNPLTATGKDALMKVDGLCNTKVIAIDADYDLLTDYHSYSNRVRNDKYVIHTMYYSIENHLLTSITIPRLSVSVKSIRINWNDIFDCISKAICNAIKLSVASIIHRDKERNLGRTSLPEVLKIKDINRFFGCVPYKPSNFSDDLMRVNANFESSSIFVNISTECSSEYASIKYVNEHNCLHLLQGHSLYSLVVKAIKYHFRKKDDVIRDSIYSATQLDMNSSDIIAIQDQIKQIS